MSLNASSNNVASSTANEKLWIEKESIYKNTFDHFRNLLICAALGSGGILLLNFSREIQGFLSVWLFCSSVVVVGAGLILFVYNTTYSFMNWLSHLSPGIWIWIFLFYGAVITPLFMFLAKAIK